MIVVELCYFQIMEEQHLYIVRQRYGGVVLDVMRSFSRTQLNSVVAATITEPNKVENQARMVSSLIVNGNALWNLSEEDAIVIQNIDNRTQLETLTLEEDVIIIRSIEYHGQLQLRSGFQYSTQIIWNSHFGWRQIMEHLQHNTYRFNFRLEQIIIGR